MTRHFTRSALGAACAAAIFGLPAHALASGFAVPEASIAGLGLANAVAANKQELGAIAYNPALASFHDGTTLSGGLLVVAPNLKVTTATGTHESTAEDKVLIPMFQLTYALNDKITLGLGANSPIGLETEWPLGTFPVLAAVDPDGAGPLQTGSAQTTTSRLKDTQISPTVSLRLNDHAAVSAGIDYYLIKEVVFSARDATNRGDGDGWGWNLSGVFSQGPLTFGASFHSKATVDVSGTSTLTITGPATLTGPATADFPLPWRLQAGVHYQASDQLGVEFDIARTGWSEFDELTINGVGGTTVSTNNWKDANAYRLGVGYQMTPQTRLRFGYAYDQTGQKDDHFSARIPDANRHLFSIGVNHELANGLNLEAGYMYVRFENRTYATTTPLGTYGADPNGTFAYNGDYKAHVHVFGVGVSKAF